LPVLDVPDAEDVGAAEPIVAGPTLGALEPVVAGEVVDVVCGVPLPVDVLPVVLDWSSAVDGSVDDVVVDEVPLVEFVPSVDPLVVVLPPVVEPVSELSVPPVVVVVVDCVAGSVMWPAGTCW
jgi:hypothetical protein